MSGNQTIFDLKVINIVGGEERLTIIRMPDGPDGPYVLKVDDAGGEYVSYFELGREQLAALASAIRDELEQP